jgi:hypothetical protein
MSELSKVRILSSFSSHTMTTTTTNEYHLVGKVVVGKPVHVDVMSICQKETHHHHIKEVTTLYSDIPGLGNFHTDPETRFWIGFVKVEAGFPTVGSC